MADATTAYGGLVVFAAVLGLGYGVRISLMPVVLIELFGMQNLGAVLGVFFTATGISAFLGPPLAGFIVDYHGQLSMGRRVCLRHGIAGLRRRSSLESRPCAGEPPGLIVHSGIHAMARNSRPDE